MTEAQAIAMFSQRHLSPVPGSCSDGSIRRNFGAQATEAVECDFLDTGRVLTNAPRKALYGLLLAQPNGSVANDDARHRQSIVPARQSLRKAGDIAEPHYLRRRSENFKARTDQDNARTDHAQARADLLRGARGNRNE